MVARVYAVSRQRWFQGLSLTLQGLFIALCGGGIFATGFIGAIGSFVGSTLYWFRDPWTMLFSPPCALVALIGYRVTVEGCLIYREGFQLLGWRLPPDAIVERYELRDRIERLSAAGLEHTAGSLSIAQTETLGRLSTTATPTTRSGSGRPGTPRERRRGLTLIEVLIVVTILGLIAGIVSVNLIGEMREAEKKAARLELGKLSELLDLYRMKFQRYPTTAEGLSALINPPEGAEPLLARSEVPRDPWGGEYLYIASDGSRPPYRLSSKGPDGQEGTDDDLNFK